MRWEACGLRWSQPNKRRWTTRRELSSFPVRNWNGLFAISAVSISTSANAPARDCGAAGKDALPALREAARSTDREIAHRAKKILDRVRWGLTPETPPEVEELVWQYRFGDWERKRKAIERLIQLSDLAYPTLLAIVSAETEQDIRSYILRQLGTKLDDAIRHVIIRGDLPVARRLLEAQALSGQETSIRNFVAFLDRHDELDDELARFRDRPHNGADAVPARILTYLQRANADLMAAKATAEKSGDARFVDAILYEAGDWKTLAQRRSQPQGRPATVEELGFQAAFHRLAGNREPLAEIMAKLQEKPAKGESTAWYRVEALLLNDRADLGIEVLKQTQQWRQAYELLVAQLRFREAFQWVEDFPSENHSTGFWLKLQRTKTALSARQTRRSQTRAAGASSRKDSVLHWPGRLDCRRA